MGHFGVMRPRHRVSRSAIELIKGFEGYRRRAAKLPDGRWTLGYGHTLTAREGAEVSEEDAEALLLYDLIAVAHVINENVFTPLTQGQFDALCSFAFNIGLDNFRRSQALKRLNEGAMIRATFAMEHWRAAEFGGERIVVDALVRRRAVERAMFLTPPDKAWTPAPSPILRPLVDAVATKQAPVLGSTAVVASMEGEMVEVSREADPEPSPVPTDMNKGGAAVQAVAEAVTTRLQAIFPDAAEPDIETSLTEAGPAAELARPLTPDSGPVVVSYPLAAKLEPQANEPSKGDAAEVTNTAAQGGPIFGDGLTPSRSDETARHEFIPSRNRPVRRRSTAAVLIDFFAGLLGLAFFGFGVFWGMNARAAPGEGVVDSLLVAWLAGLMGVVLFVVAVFRLLERLSRAMDQD